MRWLSRRLFRRNALRWARPKLSVLGPMQWARAASGIPYRWPPGGIDTSPFQLPGETREQAVKRISGVPDETRPEAAGHLPGGEDL